jgi:hypothetical protein
MDKLLEYLPLIIIGASFLFSLSRSSKKKAKEDAGRTTLPGGIGQERTPQAPQARPVYVPIQPVEIDETQDDYELRDTLEYSEHVPLTDRTPVPTSTFGSQTLLENNDYTESFSLEIKDRNELKKAILYSEILHRKYD